MEPLYLACSWPEARSTRYVSDYPQAQAGAAPIPFARVLALLALSHVFYYSSMSSKWMFAEGPFPKGSMRREI